MGNDMLTLYHCFVQPQYRRQGVASTMMRNILDYCEHNKLHYALLITQEDNDAANALYTKLGGQLHPDNRNVYYWYFTGKPQI
ncbi:MAG: GNAT family N-acetyltransferase [Erysipelotrichaceae bacterium]|nr:GNAT family N-acetyltransferase [Erysipelotrichaceae bacterium]